MNDKTLKLSDLHIELGKYGENRGKYTCTIQYEGEYGETKLVLDEEISMRLLGFIGPAITACAHKVSLKLEESIQQSIQEVHKLPELEAVTAMEEA